MFVGGDIKEITFSHPTEGSGVIDCKAAEDNTLDPGGFRSADDANMVTGNGGFIRQINRRGWRAKVTAAWDMNTRKELEKLIKLAGNPVDTEFTISHINGSIYKGTGAPLGDLEANINQATFSLILGGGKELEKIA